MPTPSSEWENNLTLFWARLSSWSWRILDILLSKSAITPPYQLSASRGKDLSLLVIPRWDRLFSLEGARELWSLSRWAVLNFVLLIMMRGLLSLSLLFMRIISFWDRSGVILADLLLLKIWRVKKSRLLNYINLRGIEIAIWLVVFMIKMDRFCLKSPAHGRQRFF